jgi:hypothetical protein
MYFRWKDRRIVVKLAVWCALEGMAESVVEGLSQHVRGLVDAGEASPPHDEQTVGLARNADPVRIDEPDRQFSLYFCDPPGELGRIEGTPIDYKCFVPRAPVEGNSAFEEALEDASGVLFWTSGGDEARSHNRTALRGLQVHLDEQTGTSTSWRRRIGDDGDLAMRVAWHRRNGACDPGDVRDDLELPDSVPVEAHRLDHPPSVYEAFEALARQVRPQIELARQEGRLPSDV